jgi:hypothetical protein
LNATQDRSLTLNYAIDLHDLSSEETTKYFQAARAGTHDEISQKLGLSGAIAAHGGIESGSANGVQLRARQSPNTHFSRRIGVTIGGISTSGFAVLKASNCRSFMNMTLQPLQAKNEVS